MCTGQCGVETQYGEQNEWCTFMLLVFCSLDANGFSIRHAEVPDYRTFPYSLHQSLKNDNGWFLQLSKEEQLNKEQEAQLYS